MANRGSVCGLGSSACLLATPAAGTLTVGDHLAATSGLGAGVQFQPLNTPTVTPLPVTFLGWVARARVASST